jgi:hypothetical protein
VETLDQYTKEQGRAQSWAKKARLGEFVNDPEEDMLNVPIFFRFYCILAAFEICFAFGKSTATVLQWFNIDGAVGGLLAPLQVLGLILAVSSIVGGVACGFLLAPERNRSSFVWTVKGLIGGPLAVGQLRELEALITQGEKQELESAKK